MSAPLPEELKTEAALELLGISGSNAASSCLERLPRRVLPHRSTAGRRPWMYRTEHLLRAHALMREAGISAASAIKVVLAELDGRL